MKMLRYYFVRILATFMAFALVYSPLSVAASPVMGGQTATPGIKAYGCDLSFWNVGGNYPDYSLVNFEKLKAEGRDFVILRIGVEGTLSRENAMDTAFLTLYEGAKKAGLGVGVYFYALATTYDEAVEDAQWCIDIFEKYNLSFEYPIYYDVEDPGNGADRPGHTNLTSDQMTSLCLGWAETLEAAGYYPGVYGYYDIIAKLQSSYTDIYDVWYAYVAYKEGSEEFVPEYQDHSGFCGMWQYSWKGELEGTSGETDVNVAYKDYPTIMKKNGYNGQSLTWEKSPSLMPSAFDFNVYSFNDKREGIVPTFSDDGSVTLTSSVDAAWAWPSGYTTLAHYVDLKETPLLKLEKSGSAHCNAVVKYIATDGTYKSFDVSALANLPGGEVDSGDRSVTVDVAAYLRSVSQMPSDGILRVLGVTYYVMGSKGMSATLKNVRFMAPPIPNVLFSSHFQISDTFVSGVDGSKMLSDFLKGLDSFIGVSVYTEHGEKLMEDQLVGTGMKVRIEAEGLVLKEYTLAITGDLNGDGKATTIDARAVLEILTTQSTPKDWQTLSGDHDQNGILSTADVRSMLGSLIV